MMNVDKMKEANRIVRTVLFFVSLALAMLFFTWGFTSYLYHCRQAKVTPPTVGRQIVTERFQAWRDTCQTNSRNFTHLWARGWTKDREQLVELRRLEIAAEHLQLIQLLKMARSENPDEFIIDVEADMEAEANKLKAEADKLAKEFDNVRE